MDNLIVDKILKMTDIVPLFVGEEACKSLHKFGPHIREYYLIHFCLSGKGTITDEHGVHKVSAGELFIIRPGEVTTYIADRDEPWHYAWIAFRGDGASVFSTERTVYKSPVEVEKRFFEATRSGILSAEAYASVIYELIYKLFSGGASPDKLHKIKRYLEYSYMEDIGVAEVARHFGFERSYLYRMFKERYGIGIKEYIIKVRMDKACELLLSGYSVADTAALVGYGDQFNFSKGFKKQLGVSPTEYRKNRREQNDVF